MLEQAIIRCKVSRGMFTDERVVELPAGPANMSFVVPSSAVRKEDQQGNGELRVQIIVYQGQTYILLPTPRRDAIPVDESDLVPA